MTWFKITPQRKDQIHLITQMLRENESELHGSQVARAFEVGLECAEQMLAIANAWVYRERVDHLLDQLQTGNLEGITPVGTLSESKGKER